MRDFAFSAILTGMLRRTLASFTLLAGCTSPAYEQFLQHGDSAGGDGSSSGESTSDAGTSGGDEPTTDASGNGNADGPATDPSDALTSTDTTSSDTSGATQDPSVGDAEKPEILGVELPPDVYAAGPVPISVVTDHTAAVRVQLDGVDAGELVDVGGGVFEGELPVHGAIDNGVHEVEVIATQGQLAAYQTAHYNVQTPKPGTEAWSQEGPTGSRTNRVAITPEGDLIEVGQTEIGGVPRPTIRKRSGVTGSELWPEGTITLDTSEGAVVDVAVLPDGRMWVVMNVREPMKDPRPRFALLDADGHATAVDILGTSGRMVRGLAADADGGCFAVGVAGVQGDWDFAYWRISATGVQMLGDVYDYQPTLDPHTFRDLASDVLIDGDIAWIVGLSEGSHEDDNLSYTRGVLVPMDLHTGEVVAPVIVAPKDGGWWHSAFYGGALHPQGVLVTGYGCDDPCEVYRIETSLYAPAGDRPWHNPEAPIDGLAYGSDVILDSQGRALVAGVVTQNGKLHGYVFGRAVGQNGWPALVHEYPGLGASEALGIVRDSFDRIFPVGYITVNGVTQARITLIHG